MERLKKIGVTGGIGAGKSTVCALFVGRGYSVYNADNRAKALLTESAALKAAVVRAFGAKCYAADGSVNRAYLGGIVFNDETKLRALNALLHPVVIEDFEKWAENAVTNKDFILKEAAILFETGTNVGLDAIIYVTAPLETRVNRVCARDGLSREEVLARVARQWPEEQKIPLADFVIENDGRPLDAQIDAAIEYVEKLIK